MNRPAGSDLPQNEPAGDQISARYQTPLNKFSSRYRYQAPRNKFPQGIRQLNFCRAPDLSLSVSTSMSVCMIMSMFMSIFIFIIMIWPCSCSSSWTRTWTQKQVRTDTDSDTDPLNKKNASKFRSNHLAGYHTPLNKFLLSIKPILMGFFLPYWLLWINFRGVWYPSKCGSDPGEQ